MLELGRSTCARLDTIVDPLVVTDLPTLVWSPHGHPEAVDALLHMSQVVLIDSVNEPDPASALARAKELAQEAYVVDLAWLRTTPWRERVASTFDPPLARLLRHRRRDDPPPARLGVAGVLFFAWLASRLGWGPGRCAGRRHVRGQAARPPRGRGAHLVSRTRARASRASRASRSTRLRDVDLARSRPGGLTAAAATERGEAELDGARRLAGRGRDPRRGDPPGAARDRAYRRALDCGEAFLR